jgi:hypothetical protein
MSTGIIVDVSVKLYKNVSNCTGFRIIRQAGTHRGIVGNETEPCQHFQLALSTVFTHTSIGK